jgi:hypothetical protein
MRIMELTTSAPGDSRFRALGVTGAAAALGFMSLALVGALTGCAPESAVVEDGHSGVTGRIDPATHEQFVFGGISLNTLEEDGDSSSLSATRLAIRHRTGAGGVLVYHDVMELVAEGAVITLSTDGADGTLLSRVLGSVKRPFEWDPSGDSSLLIASGNDEIAGRVFFEDLAIRVVKSEGGELLLSATRARLSFDLDTLVLDGSIVMTTPLGEELRSSHAAFSGDFEGIHLPAGYEIGGRRFAQGGLVIDAEGALMPAVRIPELRYDDFVNQTERAVLTHFAKRAPAELQPLIYAILAHLGPGGFRGPLL